MAAVEDIDGTLQRTTEDEGISCVAEEDTMENTPNKLKDATENSGNLHNETLTSISVNGGTVPPKLQYLEPKLQCINSNSQNKNGHVSNYNSLTEDIETKCNGVSVTKNISASVSTFDIKTYRQEQTVDTKLEENSEKNGEVKDKETGLVEHNSNIFSGTVEQNHDSFGAESPSKVCRTSDIQGVMSDTSPSECGTINYTSPETLSMLPSGSKTSREDKETVIKPGHVPFVHLPKHQPGVRLSYDYDIKDQPSASLRFQLHFTEENILTIPESSKEICLTAWQNARVTHKDFLEMYYTALECLKAEICDERVCITMNQWLLKFCGIEKGAYSISSKAKAMRAKLLKLIKSYNSKLTDKAAESIKDFLNQTLEWPEKNDHDLGEEMNLGKEHMEEVQTKTTTGQFILSRRRRRKLVYNGYAYVLHKSSPNGARFYWRCEQFRNGTCKGTAITDEQDNVISTCLHTTHGADLEKIKAMVHSSPGAGNKKKSISRRPDETSSPEQDSPLGIRLQNILKIKTHILNQPAEMLATLHHVCFGGIGSKTERKRNLMNFSGFRFKKGCDKYKKKHYLLKRLKEAQLNKLCKMLNLKKLGNKEEKVERLMDFLLRPRIQSKYKRRSSIVHTLRDHQCDVSQPQADDAPEQSTPTGTLPQCAPPGASVTPNMGGSVTPSMDGSVTPSTGGSVTPSSGKKRGRPPGSTGLNTIKRIIMAQKAASASPTGDILVEEAPDLSVQFDISQRGKRKLVYGGFSYILNRSCQENKRFYWRCELFKKGCSGTAVTDSSDQILTSSEHTIHGPYTPLNILKETSPGEISRKRGRPPGSTKAAQEARKSQQHQAAKHDTNMGILIRDIYEHIGPKKVKQEQEVIPESETPAQARHRKAVTLARTFGSILDSALLTAFKDGKRKGYSVEDYNSVWNSSFSHESMCQHLMHLQRMSQELIRDQKRSCVKEAKAKVKRESHTEPKNDSPVESEVEKDAASEAAISSPEFVMKKKQESYITGPAGDSYLVTYNAEKKKDAFSCMTCGEIFYEPARVQDHHLEHDTSTIFICDECDSMFYRMVDLQNHKLLDHAQNNTDTKDKMDVWPNDMEDEHDRSQLSTSSVVPPNQTSLTLLAESDGDTSSQRPVTVSSLEDSWEPAKQPKRRRYGSAKYLFLCPTCERPFFYEKPFKRHILACKTFSSGSEAAAAHGGPHIVSSVIQSAVTPQFRSVTPEPLLQPAGHHEFTSVISPKTSQSGDINDHPFKCNGCTKQFKYYKPYLHHIDNCKLNHVVYQCPCGKRYVSKKPYQNHMEKCEYGIKLVSKNVKAKKKVHKTADKSDPCKTVKPTAGATSDDLDDSMPLASLVSPGDSFGDTHMNKKEKQWRNGADSDQSESLTLAELKHTEGDGAASDHCDSSDEQEPSLKIVSVQSIPLDAMEKLESSGITVTTASQHSNNSNDSLPPAQQVETLAQKVENVVQATASVCVTNSPLSPGSKVQIINVSTPTGQANVVGTMQGPIVLAQQPSYRVANFSPMNTSTPQKAQVAQPVVSSNIQFVPVVNIPCASGIQAGNIAIQNSPQVLNNAASFGGVLYRPILPAGNITIQPVNRVSLEPANNAKVPNAIIMPGEPPTVIQTLPPAQKPNVAADSTQPKSSEKPEKDPKRRPSTSDYSCDICGKVFVYEKAFHKHYLMCKEMTDSNKAPYMCPCGKVFKQQGVWKNKHDQVCPLKTGAQDTEVQDNTNGASCNSETSATVSDPITLMSEDAGMDIAESKNDQEQLDSGNK